MTGTGLDSMPPLIRLRRLAPRAPGAPWLRLCALIGAGLAGGIGTGLAGCVLDWDEPPSDGTAAADARRDGHPDLARPDGQRADGLSGDGRRTDGVAGDQSRRDGPGGEGLAGDGGADGSRDRDGGDGGRDGRGDAGPKKNGEPCVEASECLSRVCAEEVCCDRGCTEACWSCRVPDHVGECTLVPAGLDPKDDCQGTPPCGMACDGSGGCVYPGPEVVCADARCQAEELWKTGYCSGQAPGDCVPGERVKCSPYACDPKTPACFPSCADDLSCAGGFYCQPPACLAAFPPGASCSRGRQCTSGACLGNRCCTSACDPMLADSCANDGSCRCGAGGVACGPAQVCAGGTCHGWAVVRSEPWADLYAVWGSASNDMFAVGEGGKIVHFDGRGWSVMPRSGGGWLWGIWGSGATNVYAVGDDGVILHYDGSAWAAMSSAAGGWLRGIWGSSPVDVWAVGVPGAFVHYDGTAWSAVPDAPRAFFYAIWGTAHDDVFVVGKAGSIYRFDGSGWAAMVSPVTDDLWGVWGRGPSDVFAVGDGGTILHYDGSQWTRMDSGTRENLRGISGVATAGGDVFAVGDGGTLLSLAGSSWRPISFGYLVPLWGVYATEVNRVVVVGEPGIILRTSGGGWVIDYEGAPPLADASGGGADDIYSCGAYGVILHYDGTAWSPLPSQTGEAFSAIWARGANDLWVAGSAAVMRHFDGRSWTEQAVPGGAMILGMSGTGAATGPRQGLAVGESGRILGFDGTSWKLLDNPDTTSLLDVWAAGADDAFAVGLSGTIVRYQAIGNTWTRMDSGTTASLFGVHGSAVGDVWVAGDGVILHHDGSAWRLSYTSSGTAFLAVWARSAIDVFAVAGHGGIFHYDGVSWRPQTSPTSNMLYALWAPASGPIYAFGDGTMVMRYDE